MPMDTSPDENQNRQVRRSKSLTQETEMIVDLNLSRISARFVFAALSLLLFVLLVAITVSRFVIGTLADDRVAATRSMLTVPAQYFPGSARLNARLAAAELSESDPDLATAKSVAERAVNLSPFDYRVRLTLAAIKEAEGDRLAAETSLRSACELAPNYWSPHYRLANLLVRQGRLDDAVDEFRTAIAANDKLLPGAVDLVWRASNGNSPLVQSLSGYRPKSLLVIAQFLLAKSRPDEAAEVFGRIDRDSLLNSRGETSTFLNGLFSSGRPAVAYAAWKKLNGIEDSGLFWNGGLESAPQPFTQFDWSLGTSEYAKFSIDSTAAHSGTHSLRIEFAGIDTTRLNDEIKHLVCLKPGSRCVLEYYTKTREFEAPEGPSVVITDNAGSGVLAMSEPIRTGTNDWTRNSVTFEIPKSSSGAIMISIRRQPRFSYDEPMRGMIWIDDFSINQL